MRTLELDGIPALAKIGLGTWQFGSREWGYGGDYADRRAHEIVQRALDLGVTLFDTAELYGFGRSERILGAALGDRRPDAFIATKLFPVLPIAPVVERRAAASAARLGVQTIDLYQVHQPNPVVGDRTTMRGMARLQDAGIIREVGVSNYSLARWRATEAALGRRVVSNQVSYSLVRRGPDDDLIPYAASSNRVVIAYSPLAQGFLSTRYTPDHRPTNFVRRHSRLFRAETLARAGPLFDRLQEIGDVHEATPSQVALAWAIRHPNVVAIPGAASLEQLELNAAAADLTLASDEADALTAAASLAGL